MPSLEINHSSEPIRLFKSDFLEFFTHIHPAVIVILWGPLGVYLMFDTLASIRAGAAAAVMLLVFLAGLFLWTFAEYTLHRFVFHFRPRSPLQEKIAFLFHGVHHAQPKCKTRLVMPPPVSIPFGALFYLLFYLVGAILLRRPEWVSPLAAGFLSGYLTYDLTHYATHHYPMRWGFLKTLKRHHMQHHYKNPGGRFGVSSPLWDLVFGTDGDG
jgi:sterol desaturase/sphingolipid hydroxylase (fatty acid hydroxylase superfamily)